MACNHIDFINFDFTRQNHSRLFRQDSFAQLGRHVVSTVFIQIEFSRDLQIRQVQAHEIQTNQPDSERLMMTRENGVGEIIKVASTTATVVALSMALGVIHSTLGHLGGFTMCTGHAARPANGSHNFKALLVVNQRQEIQFHPWLPNKIPARSHGSQPCNPSISNAFHVSLIDLPGLPKEPKEIVQSHDN